MKLNVNEYANLMLIKSPEFKDKYIKLESRLIHFIDALSECFTQDKISKPLMMYIRFLIANYTYIPHKFLSYFELSRLDIDKGEIK